jgi:hypothetical protein
VPNRGWESTVESEAGISKEEVGVAEAEVCTVVKRLTMVRDEKDRQKRYRYRRMKVALKDG